MKKHLLLPFLFIALMFSGCQEADDDVDMPVPEEPVEEQIIGEWHPDSVVNVIYGPNNEIKRWHGHSGVYSYYFGEKGDLLIAGNEDYHNSADGDYAVTQREQKNILFFVENMGYTTYSYEITSISQDKMVWQKYIAEGTEYTYLSRMP